MAYCKRCGAYIPDGLSACLACGYDENAEQAAAAAAAAQAEEQARRAAEERSEVERRRAQRQEYNKTWAENEQRNRRIEEEFRRRRDMEEEFQRRQREAEERAQSYVNRSSASRQQSRAWSGEGTGEKGNRGLAALSYLGMLLLVPMFAGQNDDYVKFHAKQGSKLLLATVIGNVLGSIFSFGWAVNIVSFVLTIKGIRNAVNGRKEELPVVGNWFKF